VYSTSHIGAGGSLTKSTEATELGGGIYCNYLVANGVVLVPIYGDANDDRALKIIGEQFPDREIIGIDARTIYENGGMVHCVTQQQPCGKIAK